MRHVFPCYASILPLFLLACSSASPNPTARAHSAPPPMTSATTPIPPPSPPPPPPSAPENAVATPAIPTQELQLLQAISLGKWPAGVAVFSDFAWVAESGVRSMAKIDLKTNKVINRVNVGRLPVDVVTGPDESIYVLERTDQIVRKISNKGIATEFARLPDAPQHTVIDNEALWVLLWDKGSSADSSIIRIDLKTKAQKRSAKLGPNAWQIGVNENHVWVGHELEMSVLDKGSLQVKPAISLRGDQMPSENSQLRAEFGRVATGPKGVYGDYNMGVVRIDPTKFEIVRRKHLGQMPMFMIPSGNDLWVATREGSIFSLNAETLDIQVELKAPERLTIQGFQVRDGLFYTTEYPRPDAKDKEEGWLRIWKPKTKL